MIEDMMALLKDERDMDAITLEDAVPGIQVDFGECCSTLYWATKRVRWPS